MTNTAHNDDTSAWSALICAAKNGDTDVFARLISGCNPNAALRWAAKEGHTECVRLLIGVSDSKAENSEALRMASTNGHTECVELLIPVSDPQEHGSLALQRAATNGHTECVKLLIPVSDPKSHDSFALRIAARNGHTDCVALLIPVSDSKAMDSWSLQAAAICRHNDIVDLLWDVSDPQAALAVLQHKHINEKHLWSYTQQKWDAHVEHHNLNAELEHVSADKRIARKRHI